MPREKKDGRYINYYLARDIYEQVAQYAQENGHTMTYATEQLLPPLSEEQFSALESDILDKWELGKIGSANS